MPLRKLRRPVRRVCTITGTRAEYGLLQPVMQAVVAAGMESRLIVAGMHLSHEFGNTVTQIEKDGFVIDARVDMAFSRDAPVATAKAIGIGVYGMAQALEQIDPDIVLVLGDRVEAFAGAISGASLNRPVAHLHGGERTMGGLDESMRHAITRLSHLHFAATEESRQRIIRTGERPEYVFNVGAPGLDGILRQKPPGRRELERDLGFSLASPFVLVVQHPVSTDPDSAALQMKETLEAVTMGDQSVVLVYPNSDAGGRRMIDVIRAFSGKPGFHSVVNIERRLYLGLLAHCAALVGNSSSGIVEAASFHTPVVNIGSRQEGRQRSANVLDVPPDRVAIAAAIRRAVSDRAFLARVARCRNPYGDGRASTRIAKILGAQEITPVLIQKSLTY